MDRYAHRLHDWLESSDFGFRVPLAAHVGALTRDSAGRRGSAGDKRSNRRKAFVRWWTQPVDPSRVVLPGPLHGPQSYAARYYFYPWRVKREAKRADVVHVLDHSYAHMIEKAGRRPVVVTVHDLMPVVVLRSPTDGWREGVRNRFLRQALKALRQADSYIVGTEWLKRELATWLGDERNIHVVPYRVADVLLFPSLYEGFGFPVIEAFASGLPVVTSGAGALKEVAGDAALVVEGRDPAAYVHAVEQLDDPDEREELIEKGWARARQFTWQKTAAMTAEIYKPLF